MMTQTNSVPTATAAVRPRAVSVVGIYMIVIGALTILAALRTGNWVQMLLGGFNVGCGIGLLKLKAGWRIAAMSWFGLMMAVSVLLLIALLRTGGDTRMFAASRAGVAGYAATMIISFIVAGLCYHA